MRATMRVSRSARTARRANRDRKRGAASRAAKALVRKPVAKTAIVPLEPVLYRFCKPGWAVLVERQPSQQGTRFVCPFCIQSHRVSGPVRGFRKVRKAQWIKLRRVDE